MSPLHRELAAIMFTDMVGYSTLAQENKALALQMLVEHRQLLRQIFPIYDGKEIEAIGDAFFVKFSSALEAVRCAIHIQKEIFDRNAAVLPKRRIRLRIGLHMGDVLAREGNLLGDGLDIAARIEPLAEAEGICLSEDVARQIRNKIELPLQRIGKRELKNIDLPVEIYAIELPWTKRMPAAAEQHTFLHYSIMRKLGEGSMSIVYQAIDTKLNRVVAMKFLKLENEDEKEFLLKEARIVASLNHPNICMIFAIEEVDGRSFLVIEYIDGPSLRQKLETETLTLREVLDIALQVAGGLKTAHEKGVIHRDIKSANIMLTAVGQAKVMDFGLAKMFDPEMESRSSKPVGTVAYMAPELLQGERPDQRADLWSLGVVLYEMATTRLPFFHSNYGASINAILKESPLPLAEFRDDLPRELERIILKCLRKNRQERYQSAQGLIADLEQLKKYLNEREKPITRASAGKKWEAPQEPEWRQITVMFTEISGYHKVAEKIGAEKAALIMKGCFEAFSTVIEKYGGNYELQDNGLIAYFGIPTAIESASQKAIHAALEMRARLQQLNQEHKLLIPFHLHMGINTGKVVAGIMGNEEKKEFTAIGATITQAAQLKAMASKGRIYVGPLTYKSTREEFEYARINHLSLNGERVPVYELLSARPKVCRASRPADRMLYAEMIGRDIF
ncbi:MAG: protein kinase domain-containing protein [bacterium]